MKPFVIFECDHEFPDNNMDSRCELCGQTMRQAVLGLIDELESEIETGRRIQ